MTLRESITVPRRPRGFLSGVGVGTGVRVGVGVGSGVGVAVGVGVGVVGVDGVGVVVSPDCAAFKALISQPKSLPSVPAPLYLELTT